MRSPFGFRSGWDDIFESPRERSRQVTSVGSGFILNEDGYIVTNAHVVAQTVDIRITSPSHDNVPATVVAVDPDHDLAVIKMDSGRAEPHLKLAAPGDIMIGETVIAIGNPFGLQHTVTRGIVSALDRDLKFSEDVSYRGLIQTDAAINPGNSGGPLLNVNGELIGVTSAIRGDAQNIGFAIPVDRLWELLPSMLDIEKRERVAVGLRVEGPESRVVSVRPDTPAARAGLEPGDRVVRFNGHGVENGIDYYVRLMQQRPGQTVKLDVRRGDRMVQVEMPLQTIPVPDGKRLAANLLGMELGPVPADLRRELELPDHVGLIVERIDRGGPADRAEIERGDLLLRINRMPVATLDEAGLALEGADSSQQVVVEGIRWRSDPAFRWAVRLRVR
jgi:serine protease Do